MDGRDRSERPWISTGLQDVLCTRVSPLPPDDFEAFFDEAPSLHPNAGKITGVVWGVRREGIANPLMRRIRCLDKLVDELAKGRPMAKIFHT